LSPFRATGLDALSKLASSLGVDTGANFKKSPGYDFVFNEAMRGVNAGAADRGLIGSGARLKALQDRAAGLASTDYYKYKQFANDEYFNTLTQLGNMARMGATATGAGADATLHTTDKMAQFYGDIAGAKVKNINNQANNWGQVWSDASTGINGFGDSPLGKIFALEW
jgi:hypothetical protein